MEQKLTEIEVKKNHAINQIRKMLHTEQVDYLTCEVEGEDNENPRIYINALVTVKNSSHSVSLFFGTVDTETITLSNFDVHTKRKLTARFFQKDDLRSIVYLTVNSRVRK
jgi:hypothetical protein